jgi:hypothetical protein
LTGGKEEGGRGMAGRGGGEGRRYRGTGGGSRNGRYEGEEDDVEVFMDSGREGSSRRGERGDRRMNEEGEGLMEDDGRRGGEKRTADQRSPNSVEERRNRPRLDEFDIGERFDKVAKRMEDEVKRIVSGMKALDGEENKGLVKYVVQGLNTMVKAVVETMNEMEDAVAENRKNKEDDKKEMEERMRRMEEKAKENEVRMEAERKERETERKKESVREMEDKLKVAGRQIKLLDMDFGKVMSNRKEMVERVVDNFKEDVKLTNRKRLDTLLRRTRIIILGKETVAVTVRGKRLYTVPVLLECRNEDDKEELSDILRDAEYFGTYHWPVEIMDYVKAVRENVKRMGYSEDRQFIRIRPEEREGRMQLKADVKEKNGGRFWLVATWGIPPLDKQLRGPNELVAKWMRAEGRK